jgi:hypothetical protein
VVPAALLPAVPVVPAALLPAVPVVPAAPPPLPPALAPPEPPVPGVGVELLEQPKVARARVRNGTASFFNMAVSL